MSLEIKPALPSPTPEIEPFPGLKAKLLSDFSRYSSGSMSMYLNRITVSVNDVEIGALLSDIRGVWYIEIGEALYAVPMEDVFHAYLKAHKESLK